MPQDYLNMDCDLTLIHFLYLIHYKVGSCRSDCSANPPNLVIWTRVRPMHSLKLRAERVVIMNSS